MHRWNASNLSDFNTEHMVQHHYSSEERFDDLEGSEAADQHADGWGEEDDNQVLTECAPLLDNNRAPNETVCEQQCAWTVDSTFAPEHQCVQKTHKPRKRVCLPKSSEDGRPTQGGRPRSARISLLQDQHLASTAAAAAAEVLPAKASSSTDQTLRVVSNLQPARVVGQLVACQDDKTMILQACKFHSKHTNQDCQAPLSIVVHKRNHLAVSCAARHQWVWCNHCCTCQGPDRRERGCTTPTHWCVNKYSLCEL